MERQITDLYDETILSHNKTPVNFEKRVDAQHIVEAYNPLCGDKFKLFLDVKDDHVTQVSFHGYGCAVSKAATSVLVKKLEKQRLADAQTWVNEYLEKLQSDDTEGGHFADIELRSFEVVRQFPERLTCAILSWEAINDFFKKQKNS